MVCCDSGRPPLASRVLREPRGEFGIGRPAAFRTAAGWLGVGGREMRAGSLRELAIGATALGALGTPRLLCESD